MCQNSVEVLVKRYGHGAGFAGESSRDETYTDRFTDAEFDLRSLLRRASFSDENKTRSTKNYVPIDVREIGKELDVDSDIIFGRLFYHFDRKYGYKKDDGAWVHFFAIQIGGDRHCIHYPYLGSVVADLRDESKKFRIATSMAAVSLVISVTSFVISTWPGG